MNQGKYDLAVAWRVYPKVSKQPILNVHDKLEIVRLALLSFQRCTVDLTVFHYFILDACPPSYSALVRSVFNDTDIEIINTDGIGNNATFCKQVEILLAQTKSDRVYFSEDDYIYKEGASMKDCLRFLTDGPNNRFVSLYFPFDVFGHPIHGHRREARFQDGTLWLSINSTCLTFLTTKDTLFKSRKVFATYGKKNNDCAIWLTLTKTHVRDFFSYPKLLRDERTAGILEMAIKHGFLFFFTTPQFELFAPFPAMGTHLEKGNESPGIDWEHEIEMIKKIQK